MKGTYIYSSEAPVINHCVDTMSFGKVAKVGFKWQIHIYVCAMNL